MKKDIFKIFLNFKEEPKTLKAFQTILSGYAKMKISPKIKSQIDLAMFPQSPLLFLTKNKLKSFSVGAQNVSSASEGAFTGEISAKILIDLGAKYVIVGHSERRGGFGETDEVVSAKVQNALTVNLRPVICFGESDRKDSSYIKFLTNSLKKSLSGVPKNKAKNIILAYEPVWAIGENAKRSATEKEIAEIVMLARKVLADLFDSKIALSIPILYGGSVGENLSAEFVSESKIGGVLVGRLSLEPEKIKSLIHNIFINENSK